MKNKVKILTIILIIAIFFSTASYAIYRNLTLGEKSLTFALSVSTQTGIDPSTNPEYKVNPPKLDGGMIPIKYNGTNWAITNNSDSEWYNYSSNLWANVMLSDNRYKTDSGNVIDSLNGNILVATDGSVSLDESELGSMFVWIPRYEYRIIYEDENQISSGGTININFISINSLTPTENYTIHPAFRNGLENNYENGEWSSEIDGIWFSKFESSNSSNTFVIETTPEHIKSLPNYKGWSNLSIEEAFNQCMEMGRTDATYYGINSITTDTHLTKNSEWGAVAYLAYSIYGRNRVQPNINNYMANNEPRITNTGYGGVGTQTGKVTSILANSRYNAINGLLASTTGNITGVYDMSGGLNEHTAAFYTGKSISTYSENTKYTTKYTNGDMRIGGKIGDATFETYNWDGNAVGNSNNNTSLISQYFLRGGAASNGTAVGKSGVFAYFNVDGTGGTGGASQDFRGFRPTIIVNNV